MIIINKTVSIIITIVILFSVIAGCSVQSDLQNNNQSTEDTLNDNINTIIIVDNTYNSWVVTSKTEYIIIDGILYGRGENVLGLFGNDINKFYDTWTKISENVQHIEATEDILMYLTNTGALYGLGIADNDIFYNKKTSVNSNQLITDPLLLDTNCKYFSLSNEYVITLKSDNTLWFWGESKHGQSTSITDKVTEPTQIFDNVQFIKAFGYTIAWIDFYGNLYLCGDNSFNQIGNGKTKNGISDVSNNIVSTPFCALKKCNSFSVSSNMVINATTDDGTNFIWGNYHNSIPTEKSKAFPQKMESTDFSKGVILQNNNNVLSKSDYPIMFHKEKDDLGNFSIISKSSNLDENRSIVKTNLVPPFTMSFIGNALTISSKNDNCLYLITYNESSGGQINNIKTSLLYEYYALPIYVKDSSHLVLALPQTYKESILDTHSGEIQEGAFWNYDKFDNKPSITPSEAENIALKELSKSKYSYFNEKNHDFSNVEFVSLVFEPNLQCFYLNSWITPEALIKKDSITWCYHIQIKDSENSFDTMEIYIDADTGAIYSIVNTSN